MIYNRKDILQSHILVVNIEGNYYVVSNISHEGARLHEGRLTGKEFICPWHGAKWHVTTRKLIMFPEKLKLLRSKSV